MKKFFYRGLNPQGVPAEGWVHASSLSDAATKLNALGFISSDIHAAQDNQTAQDFIYSMFPQWGITPIELILLFSQLQSLSQAGVSILVALQSIHETCENKRLKQILYDIIISVESGYNLSESMRLYSGIFNTFITSLVSIGEKTGGLGYAFGQIRIYLEESLNTRRQLKLALRYPIFVVLTLLVGLVALNFFVIPVFAEFFSSFSAELPMPTKILIAISSFCLTYSQAILFVSSVLIISIMLYYKTPSGRIMLGKQKIKLPFVGELIEHTLVAQFCAHLSHSLKANVQILTALQMIANISDNHYFRQKVNAIRARIETGEPLSQAMTHCQLFSPILIQMVSVGEKTGDLEGALKHIAQFYTKEVDYGLKSVAEKMEPILILIISGMVLMLALGVFLPMWDISTVALQSVH